MNKRHALFALLLTLVLFQNCAKTTFTSVEDYLRLSENSSTPTEGNGTGYGGKLVGNFYRFNPDFTCEGKASPVASIAMTETENVYSENKKLICGATKSVLATSLIERSIYQNDIVGFQDGIFESEKSVPTSIPSNLVEIWCRDSADRNGIETITHFDRSSQSAVTRIFAAGAGSDIMTIPDFNVSRVVSSTEVKVQDGKDFSLTVYRNRPAAQLGLFQGSMQATIKGQKISRETFCRLGGSLDAKVWPARQIVDLNILSFKFSPDLQSFAFTSKAAAASPNLFASDLRGTLQAQITGVAMVKGVLDFDFTRDSNSFVYWADQRISNVPELFYIRRDGTDAKQLGNPLSQSEQTQNYKLQFSADGSQVIYEDGHQATFVDNEMSLNTVAISGGSPVTISPPSAGADDSVHDFVVSKKSNRVAFLTGVAFSLKVYLSNLDGTGLQQVAITYPATGWSIPYGTTLNLPEPGRYVFVQSLRTTGAIAFMTSAIAMDGSHVTSFPVGWSWKFSNAAGDLAVITDSQSPPNFKLIHLDSGFLQDLPSLQPRFFSNDDASLVATTPDGGGKFQHVLIDVTSGVKTSLCQSVLDSASKLQDLGGGKWLLLAWDETTGILNFYLHASGQCAVKNSIPVPKPSIKEISVTADGLKAVIAVSVNIQGQNQDQLYFVPLNGKAPLRIDSPVYVGAHVSNLQLLPDSKTVFYTGDQIGPGDTGAFLWTAP